MAISRRTLLQRLGAGALYAAASRHIAFAESTASNTATASLRRKIAALHNVTLDRVVLSCGSTDVVQMAILAFAGSGKTIITARPTLETIAQLARRTGSQMMDVALSKDYSHDLEAMRARVDARTGLIYICNPNHATGSLTPRQDVDSMLRTLPPDVRVVVDEAYHDFVGQAAEYRSLIDRCGDPRVIVTRSLSSIHGLAGVRIGYGIAAASTAATVRAQACSGDIAVAAARAGEAALEHPERVRASVDRIGDDRQEFLNQANARMLRSIESLTDFVMLHTGRPSAQAVVDHFAKHRILVAGPLPGLEQYIRVSIGTLAETREFWRVWDLMPGNHMRHM